MNTYKILTLLLIMLIISCKATREGIKEDYKGTRDDVVDVFTKSPEEIKEEKVELKASLEAMKFKLTEYRNEITDNKFSESKENDAVYTLEEIEQSLQQLAVAGDRIDKSTDQQWNDVKNSVEDTVKDIDDRTSEMIEALFVEVD